MNANPPESNFNHWWWRAWYVFVALALLWLGTWFWLSRPAPEWMRGWVGWWSGDREASRPLWNLKATLAAGAELADESGDLAYRSTGGHVSLGHWRDKSEAWTWAGWVQVKEVPDVSGSSEVELVSARAGDEFKWQLCWRAGRVIARLEALNAATTRPEDRLQVELVANRELPQGRWVRLAFTSERGIHRLFADGVLVAETTTPPPTSIQLAQVALLSHWVQNHPERVVAGLRPKVLFDDVVMWDRALTPGEIASWAGARRGIWSHTVYRQAFALAWWRWGKALVPGGFILLALLKGLHRPRVRLGLLAEELPRPSFRPAIAVTISGLLLTAGATAWTYQAGRRADKAAFDELLERNKSDLDGYWQHIANLGLRARDWLEAHPDPTPQAWAEWLSVNHFPHDYYGLVGIGYAEQVLPETRVRQEAKWATRHGFDFRVRQAGAGSAARPIHELGGQPLLPVVLYQPATGSYQHWETNGSLLGRDLLYVPKTDRREWSESRRVEEAVARNEITSSSVEELLVEGGGAGHTIQGLLLYVPVTQRKKGNALEALPPEDWRGVVFLSVDFKSLVNDILRTRAPLAGFRMFTGSMGGAYFDLVVDTGELLPETADRPDAYRRGLLEVPHYQHRLWVALWSTPEFEERSTRTRPWWMLGVGTGLTAMMASLLVVQIRAREAQAEVLEALRVANAGLLLAHGERERLSRDLHDGSIQNLYGLGLHLQRVQTLLAASPERARTELNDSLSMLDQSIAELRQFILTAGVDHLPQHTVTSALEGLVARLRKTTAIDLQLHLDTQADLLTPRASVEVLHIVREAVSNALRHAEATRIEVRLERAAGSMEGQPEHWRLTVADDGRGFEVLRVNGNGSGLKNLTTRADELGGRVETQSAPGAGTRVVVEFPG